MQEEVSQFTDLANNTKIVRKANKFKRLISAKMQREAEIKR